MSVFRRTPRPSSSREADEERTGQVPLWALRDAASVLDGLCQALGDVAERGPDIGGAWSAAADAEQLRELRGHLWPHHEPGPGSYGGDREWYVDFRHIFREGAPDDWDELCQASATARVFGGIFPVRCLGRPGHADRHNGRVVKGSLPDGEAEFFYWSDGDVTPLTND